MSKRQEKRRKEKKGWGEGRKTTEKQEAKIQEIICLRSIGHSNLLGTEHKLERRYVRVIWNKSKIESEEFMFPGERHGSCWKVQQFMSLLQEDSLYLDSVLPLYFHFIYPVNG